MVEIQDRAVPTAIGPVPGDTRRVYKKPKERRKESAARVKRLRLALGDTQVEFAKRLTQMALAEHSHNITGIWAVQAWEKARREPDAIRTKLLDRLEEGLGDGSGTAATG